MFEYSFFYSRLSITNFYQDKNALLFLISSFKTIKLKIHQNKKIDNTKKAVPNPKKALPKNESWLVSLTKKFGT